MVISELMCKVPSPGVAWDTEGYREASLCLAIVHPPLLSLPYEPDGMLIHFTDEKVEISY